MRRRSIHLLILVTCGALALLGPLVLAADDDGDGRDTLPANLRVPADLGGRARETLEAAIEAYREAFDAKEDERGRSEKSFKKAISKLKTATRHPELAELALPWFYLGSAYNQVQSVDDAREPLEEAVRLGTRFYQAHALLAEVLVRSGEHDAALAQFDLAVKIQPRYLRALRGRVETLVRLGRFEEAVRAAQATIKVAGAAARKDEDEPDAKRLAEEIADLGLLVIQLQFELRSDAAFEHEFESENYIVKTDLSEEFAEEIATDIERIRRVYLQVFPGVPRPPRKYEVIVHSNERAYHAAGGPPTAGGHYSPLLRRLELYRYKKKRDTLLVLQHEAFHQFLHDYLERAPQWFNEGVADYFGAYEYVTGGGREGMKSRVNPWRVENIKYAIRAKRNASPDELMKMNREQMYGDDAALHYAMAWSLVHFMLEDTKGGYRKLLVRYFSVLREGLGTEAAYDETFGRIDMKRFEKAWVDYTLRLPNE